MAHNTHRWTVLWKLGDAHRDLQPEIVASDRTFVILTAHGTARVISRRDRTQMRLPAQGGICLLGDGDPEPLGLLEVATPCGLVTWSRSLDARSVSSPLVTLCVLDDDGTGFEGLAVRLGGGVPVLPAPGHPSVWCGALHCPWNLRRQAEPGEPTSANRQL